MSTFHIVVIAHKTVRETYRIDADTPAQAMELWHNNEGELIKEECEDYEADFDKITCLDEHGA